jgi:rhodanese-related sulfurtransferase
MEPQRVSAEEAKQLYLTGTAVLVDARSLDAYDRSEEHVPGDIRVPPERAEVFKQILPTDHVIVTYCTCPEEQSSTQVARVLVNGGWSDVRVLNGGFSAWSAAGGPVSKKVKLQGES